MSTPPKPKFKFKKTVLSELMPNGYRLATVEEVDANFEAVKRRGLLEVKMNYDEWDEGRLLNGRIRAGYRLEHSFARCDWGVVVQEIEWDVEAGGWKKKCSAFYPSNGNLLRAKLYDGINLSEQDRKIALALASINGDAEVICWLLKTTNALEFQGFQNLFRLPKMKRLSTYFSICIPEFYSMAEYLCTSKFPLQLPLEQDSRERTALDYLINLMNFCRSWRTALGISSIELLIEVYPTGILHSNTGDGKAFLDTATSKAIQYGKEWIEVLTKLLSLSPHAVENQILEIKHCFGDILIKAVERGYTQLAYVLLDFKDSRDDLQLATDVCLEVARGAILKGYTKCLENILNSLKRNVGTELQQDKDGKTLFHHAAKSENGEISQKIGEAYMDWYKVNIRDNWGRTFLHWAALVGHFNFCKDCIKERKLKVDTKDKLGQNSLHLAAKGIRGHLVVDLLLDSSSVHLVHVTDGEGRTPLHFASAKGNIKMVEKLLERLLKKTEGGDDTATGLSQVKTDLKKLIEQTDGSGKTALQMAAQGGHTRIVQRLLKEDIDPFLPRDVHGSTALHYATGVEDGEVALAMSKSLVNKYTEGDDNRSLMLWASAAGIGTADERKRLAPLVKNYLLQEKHKHQKHLLKAAARTGNVEMAWEVLHRGADIADIKHLKSDSYSINRVIKEIEIANEQGQDKPSTDDNLGRNVFADGLAALFLNQFVESPITVGICGEWGMGKSSVMFQTENILLLAASQLSFPNLVPFEDFVGAKKLALSTKGRKIYRRMKNAACKLFPQKSAFARMIDAARLIFFLLSPGEVRITQRMRRTKYFWSIEITPTENPLIKLLEDHHPEYHAIYKSLACMDVRNQMLSSVAYKKNQLQPMKETPRILTIRYNAWHYRDEHEAWAGLAVTITKEIEQVMTRAQRFSTCWRYSWAKNGVNMCIQIFLPCLLATFLAGWVAWVAWTLLREAKFKELKYGSIPFTIIAIVWGVLKSIISVVKPVSTQMMGYINSPDHTTHLGYQQQVISDINFLKGELGKKPHWVFSFIAGDWCWNWLGLYPDNVENTRVPKFSPASEDQLRMIAFVDDLDRCDQKVIIQVLSAINLVLAECKINVVLGIDKKMIQKAVERHFEDKKDRDLADKFICKIIQIPLSLPELAVEELDKFLQHYIRQTPPTRTTIRVEDGESTDFGEIDTDDDDTESFDESQKQESMSLDSGSSNRRETRSHPGIVKKVFNGLTCIFQNLGLLACNLPNELQQMKDVANKKEISPLTFSKGSRLTREMLLSKYSLEEANVLYRLEEFVTGNQKFPREWKRFLDYYKFTCNILSMVGKVYKLPSWRVELVAWTLICWQWKHEMNTLIKGWHKYADVKRKVKGKDKQNEVDNQDEKVRDKNVKVEDEVNEDWAGPSLKQIVKNYIRELHKELKESYSQVVLEKDRRTIQAHEGIKNSKECSTQDSLLKENLAQYGHDTTNFEERQHQFYNWLKLLEVLHDVQDVSMKGIQLFQQFRFHCEIDNLPWPLPEPSEALYERLMQ